MAVLAAKFPLTICAYLCQSTVNVLHVGSCVLLCSWEEVELCRWKAVRLPCALMDQVLPDTS